MRAAWYDRNGPAREVLEVGEMPTPDPGPGEVRVRLEASGVNPADVKLRSGASSYGWDFPRVIPNSDGAGVVDGTGEGVQPGWLGRRVWLYNGQRLGRAFGTAAEWIALDVRLVTELPDAVKFTEGACLGIPCMTAHFAVFADGPVAGRALLVTGGAGAVGHYAIQLAKWGGATVIATVSGPEKAEHARAAGANHVVNYRDEDVAARVLDLTDGVGVDRIVEVDFGGNLETSLKTLKLNGQICGYASDGDAAPRIPFRELMRRNILVRPFVLNSVPLPDRDRARHDIVRWLRDGRRLHRVDATFPLAEIAAAHERVEAGGKLGTVVVEPQR
jgi:NADPH:quinone reductase